MPQDGPAVRARARRRARASMHRAASWVAAFVAFVLAIGLMALPGGAALAATPAPAPVATETAPENDDTAPTQAATAAPSPSSSEPVEDDTAPPAPVASPSVETPAPLEPAREDIPAAPLLDDAQARAPPADGAQAETEADAPADDAPFSTMVQTLMAGERIGILAAGIPEAPRQVWIEDFEGASPPAQLGTYASGRYTAGAYWLDYVNCNGVIASYAMTFPTSGFCATPSDTTYVRNAARRAVDVLGQLRLGVAGSTSDSAPANGSTTASQANRGLAEITAYTSSSTPNQAVIESVAAVGLSAATDRYYLASMDVAEDSCSARPGGANNNSRLDVALVVAGAARALTAAPIIACNITGGRYTSPALPDGYGEVSVRAGRFTTDTAVRLTPAQAAGARLRVSNQISATLADDFALDNLRILDATPTLDTAFSAGVVTAGTPTTLTFTVTNTSDLVAKSDWGFTDALPSGLVVAPTPAVGGSCVNVTGTAFSVSAPAGASAVSVAGGDLAASAASCTVTVDVVSGTPGTYTNGASNITSELNPPATATSLVVEAPARITIQKSVSGRAAPADQFRLALSSGATEIASATTTGSNTGVQTERVGPIAVTRGATYTIAETIVSTAALDTYLSSYQCVRGSTTIATGSSQSGPITIPDEAGAEIVCTFSNAPQAARLYCDGNFYYGVRANGSVVQVNAAGTGTVTQLVAAVTGATDVNALGVSGDGSTAIAADRATGAANVGAIVNYSITGGGALQGTRTALTTAQGALLDRAGVALDGTVIAGAVDPLNGRFLVGKSAVGSVRLWEYTPTTLTNNSRFLYLGQVATGTTAGENGDISFDAQGNLHIVQTPADSSNVGTFSVTREALAAASGTTLPSSASVRRALSGTDSGFALTAVNGMAFSPTGTVYLGNGTTAYQFDPSTWVRIPGSPRATIGTTATGAGASDLAACTAPSTLSVEKNVVGRINTADQFRLATAVGSPAVETSVATTSGAATGVQVARIGPMPVQTTTAVTISETMATGSVSPITAYPSVLECWADGIRIFSGTDKSATVTIPNRLSVGVACTFTNSPVPFATVRVTKIVEDAGGGGRTPTPGWTMTTTATANTGSSVSILPSRNPAQQTGADGSATWQVLFGAASHRGRVVVAETTQTGLAYQSLTCTVNGAAGPTTVTTVGDQVRGALGVDVAPGNAVDCVFSNRPVATLTLVKSVSYGSASPSAWQLAATRSVATALPGPSGAGGAGTLNAVPVSADTPYRLSETGGPATYVQVGAWTCASAAGPVAVSAAGDVTLSRGTAVTCTVVNATSSLVLLKNVQNPSTGFQPSTWNLTATPATLSGLSPTTVAGADFQAGGNPASTFDARPGHSYTLSEDLAQSGTRLAYRQVRLERRETNGTWTAVTSPTVAAPTAGQTAVYRFVNAPVVPAALPLTGGPATDSFLLAGSAVLAVALALAIWHRRRRARRGVF